MAQATQPHAHHPAAAASADVDVPVTAEAAVAVAERFNSALSSGDLATVEALLAADVLILASGGAEHSREEYVGHHAVSDAALLKGAHRHQIGRAPVCTPVTNAHLVCRLPLAKQNLVIRRREP